MTAVRRAGIVEGVVLLLAVSCANAAGGVFQIVVTRQDGSHGAGSAVQLAPGLLVGSCHTLRDAARVVVFLAELVYRVRPEQADRNHDLCLMRTAKLGGAQPERVPSAQLRVGEAVTAYGFSSAYNMAVAEGRITALHGWDGARVIRTSAPFPAGASGGALFDSQGRLVGVLAFRARDSDHHYALPMEWVERLLESGADSAAQEASFWEDDSPAQPDFLRAVRLTHARDWVGLEALAQRWTVRDPVDAEAWLDLGRAHLALGNAEGAETALQRTIELAPDEPSGWFWAAQSAHARGDLELEHSRLRRLEELDAGLAQDVSGGRKGRFE